MIHRDIKPANIIVGKHGETLVVDWGLAKAVGRADPTVDEQTLAPSSSSSSSETLPGSALGTPAYMSPEQARGDPDHLGPRSDVYSLGATLHCLLTGKPPFAGDDMGAILRAVQAGEFPRPSQRDSSIDRALETVCPKAMALRPEDRYPTPKALADDLERWMADEPVTAWREPFSRRARRGPAKPDGRDRRERGPAGGDPGPGGRGRSAGTRQWRAAVAQRPAHPGQRRAGRREGPGAGAVRPRSRNGHALKGGCLRRPRQATFSLVCPDLPK